MPRLRHPGPTAPHRSCAVPCKAEAVTVDLTGGVPLLDALAAVFGDQGAWLDLIDLPAQELHFVRPAPARDTGHVAWYSDTRILKEAIILRAGVHYGQKDGAPFSHIHGVWEDATGAQYAGHLLAEHTVLAQGGAARGYALTGARMQSVADTETGFMLFQPALLDVAAAPNAVLGTLRPHSPLPEGLCDLARAGGLESAALHGLGSLVGTQFADKQGLSSLATEVLLTNGDLNGGRATLDAVSVGFTGPSVTGRLQEGNRVCVTFEVLMVQQ